MSRNLELSIYILLISSMSCFGQNRQRLTSFNNYHKVSIGDKVPNINFNNKQNFPSGMNSLSDYKGKIILLDFWATWCGSCLRNFPNLEKLQKEFGEHLQIILINSDEDNSSILKRIGLIRHGANQDKSLSTLPTVLGDSQLKILFPHQGVPHHVWIDTSGKVLAITNGSNATEENVRKLLSGQKMNFAEKKDLIGYDIKKNPFIKPAHEFLPELTYYSMFMKYFAGIGSGCQIKEDSINNTYRFQFRNTSILGLYHAAYPEFNTRIMLETSDNDINDMNFISSPTSDDWKIKNLYCYETIIPLSEKKNFSKYMREEINRYFGINRHIKGAIQKRKMNAYVLIKKANTIIEGNVSGKLKPLITKTDSTVKYNQYDLSSLSAILHSRFDDYKNNIAFVDETGLNDKAKISFEIPLDKNDQSALKRNLNAIGLDLIRQTRELEMLVIKDYSN